MLGKEKDLNIQLKPQQIPETKQIKKKVPQARKNIPHSCGWTNSQFALVRGKEVQCIWDKAHNIQDLQSDFQAYGVFSQLLIFFAFGRSIKENRTSQILNKPTFKIFTLEKYPTKWHPFSSFFVRT